MRHASLDAFLAARTGALARGPVALIFVEDAVEVASTLRHHLDAGFRSVLAFMRDDIALAADLAPLVHRIRHHPAAPGATEAAVNRLIAAAPDRWFYYGYNAEYLFYPFAESRTVGEMLSFHAGERRDAMLACVVDLYAGDLARYPGGVSRETAHLDRTGYYALRREGGDGPLERQYDIYGGLRWRFEEHVAPARRRIDRIALFRSRKGLRLGPDGRFSIAEYNTYACPWHHNLTAAVCSFRAAKALKANPGSREAVASFHWHNSVPFRWQSQQLMDLGLMEPGQWF